MSNPDVYLYLSDIYIKENATDDAEELLKRVVL